MSEPALYRHVVAGIFIGPMGRLEPGEFGAVLTLGSQPGAEIEHTKFKHYPLSYQNPTMDQVQIGAEWVLQQVRAERTVLIRSERGRQRPALVAAFALLSLGAAPHEAELCIVRADRTALSDFRFRNMIKDFDLALRRRRGP